MLDLLAQPHTTHARSMAKSVTWRALGSIDTFILSFLITGNFVWAGSIASLEVVSKMVLYYAHERAWGRINWGLRPIVPDHRVRSEEPGLVEMVDRPLPARHAVARQRLPAA